MVEHDVLGIFDMVGRPAAAFKGRCDGPKFSTRPVLPLRAHGESKQSPESKFLWWVAERCRTAVKRARNDGMIASPFFAEQSRGFCESIRQLSCESRRVCESQHLLTSVWNDIFRRFMSNGLFCRSHLDQIERQAIIAEIIARDMSSVAAKKREADFLAWFDRATDPRYASSGLCKASRDPKPYCHDEHHDGSPMRLHDFLEETVKKWEKVWETSERAYAEIKIGITDDEWMAIQPPMIEELRVAARKFRAYTGTSGDAFRPRHFAMCSDQTLSCICRFSSKFYVLVLGLML